MSANVFWSSEDDEMLIDFVKNHEILYNVKSKDYRKTQLKQNMWKNIGTTLERSGSECFKRWAYIRDYHIRRRGKPGTGSSGEAARKRCDLLSFLDCIPTSQRTTITNFVGDENETMKNTQATNEDTVSHNNEIDFVTAVNSNNEDNNINGKGRSDDLRDKKKKKITHSEERLQLLQQIAQRTATPAQNELDETDLFFSLMAKIVKKLPRYEQIQLRMQISSLVGNAELRSISNESRQSNHSGSNSTPSASDVSVIVPSPERNESRPFCIGDEEYIFLNM